MTYYYILRYTQVKQNPLARGFHEGQVSKVDVVINFKSQDETVKKLEPQVLIFNAL